MRRHAVTVLPAVASLKALREVAVRAPAPQPYLGFGDPIFSPRPAVPPASPRARLAAVCGARTREWTTCGGRLPPLPDTADELRAVARALGVPPTQVKLAQEATERAVKTARLSDYRILHFATHGLDREPDRALQRARGAGARAHPAADALASRTMGC